MAIGLAASVLGMPVLAATPAGAREALTGQCGVDSHNTSWTIGSDGQLSATLTESGKGRVARFRFHGVDGAPGVYDWWFYQYRYQVTETNFGPQSNEVVEFRREQDPPRSGALWDTYESPDNHNSNLEGGAEVQWMDEVKISPAGDTEIWVKAIFDVPSTPDPSCWTNAIALK